MEETEETTSYKKSFQPKTMAELLPNLALSGLLSKDAIFTLTAKKKPRQTMASNRTSEKAVKLLTMAEIKAEIQAFTKNTPARAQPATSTRKKGWNSSVKVDKKVNHTADGKLRNNVVRKVLNFQPPRPAPSAPARTVTNTRMTMMPSVSNPRMTMVAPVPHSRKTLVAASADTPKFSKPDIRAKKSLYIQAKSSVRISGICNIPETPVDSKPVRPKVTTANKENNPYPANVSRNLAPKLINHKKLAPPAPYTPLSNDSWKSGSDASFIQQENEIHETEQIINDILDRQHTLENIAEVSPPIATPFREYRENTESFNNSSVIDTSTGENDTIMCFENLKVAEKANEREESVIVSLCDMLNKATVNNTVKQTSEINELLDVERQTEHNVKMIYNCIQVLKNIGESQQKTLDEVRLLIRKKKDSKLSDHDKDKTLVVKNIPTEYKSPEKSPILGGQCSVIRASPKSPSYKIPNKISCLRKKVFYKSMPNVISDMSTPVKLDEGKALNMYMKMKEQLHFLNTPLVKARPAAPPDTPAVTSQNLKMQLNKLYGS